ncbi:MAG: hypothetical protein ACE5NG_11000, partial [bacterium]
IFAVVCFPGSSKFLVDIRYSKFCGAIFILHFDMSFWYLLKKEWKKPCEGSSILIDTDRHLLLFKVVIAHINLIFKPSQGYSP